MTVSASQVKELRDKTGAGMMDCKRALADANGDMGEAIKLLRQRGIVSAAKKASRETSEGQVAIYISPDGEVGAMVEVNCETDFVARNSIFQDFAGRVAELVGKSEDLETVEQLLGREFDCSGRTLRDHLAEMVMRIGENIAIRRFVKYTLDSDGFIASYIHFDGRIGVIVEVGCSPGTVKKETFREVVKNIAMQIAASNPISISRDDLPKDIIESEREVYRTQARNEGKPERIIDKIVEGKINRYYKEVCLLEQPFVRDTSKTVGEYIEENAPAVGDDIQIRRFARYTVGG
ncbi:MAG: translation elongation factor Ts [bacterium]